MVFGGSVADLDLPTLEMLSAEVPTAHLDRSLLEASHARRFFLRDRRPELYGPWLS